MLVVSIHTPEFTYSVSLYVEKLHHMFSFLTLIDGSTFLFYVLSLCIGEKRRKARQLIQMAAIRYGDSLQFDNNLFQMTRDQTP